MKVRNGSDSLELCSTGGTDSGIFQSKKVFRERRPCFRRKPEMMQLPIFRCQLLSSDCSTVVVMVNRLFFNSIVGWPWGQLSKDRIETMFQSV